MPKYTFSTREKVLLALFALLLVGGLWYRFVFVAVQDRVSAAQSEEAAAYDTMTIDAARITRKQQMLDAIAEFKAQGIEKRVVPPFDNFEAVTAQLYEALRTSSSYDIQFDALSWTEDGYVARGVSLTYASGSYVAAKGILTSLYGGDFPCQVDALSITDDSGQPIYRGAENESPVSVTAHLTYFEEVTDASPTKGLPPRED